MLIEISTNIAATAQEACEHADGSMGKNVIAFEADMSSFVYIDNKTKDILIFGKGPTEGSDNTKLTVEAIYPINFTLPCKRLRTTL